MFLKENNIDGQSVCQLLQLLPHVKHLDLSNCYNLLENHFEPIGFKNLQSLSLTYCNVWAKYIPGIFAALPALRLLDLSYNPLKDEGVELLA